MSSIKVLIITETVQHYSGIGRYSLATLNEYPGLGVEPTIITLKNKKSKGKIKNEMNILFPLISLIDFLRNAYAVRRVAKDFRTVHAFDVWPYGVYAYLAVIATRKKLFLTGVGTYSVAPGNLSLKKVAMNLAYGRAQRVYCISEYTENRIKKRTPRAKTEVVYLGLTKMPAVDAGYLAKTREKYNIKNYFPVFITVGQIKSRKGQLDTFQALKCIKSEFPNFLYLMVGSDEDRVYVDAIIRFATENNLRNNIRIITGAGDRELSALYALSHVFCLNSNNEGEHFEGFGLVFLEAAQFGVPGIGSKNCGIESAVKDGYSGYLTAQGDSKDIAKKMKEILIAENRAKMGTLAMAYASRFSWKKTAERFISGYEKE